MQRAALRCKEERKRRATLEMEFILGERRCSASFTSDERKNGFCLHRPYEIVIACRDDQTGRQSFRWEARMLGDIIGVRAMYGAGRRSQVMLT